MKIKGNPVVMIRTVPDELVDVDECEECQSLDLVEDEEEDEEEEFSLSEDTIEEDVQEIDELELDQIILVEDQMIGGVEKDKGSGFAVIMSYEAVNTFEKAQHASKQLKKNKKKWKKDVEKAIDKLEAFMNTPVSPEKTETEPSS